MRGTKRKAEERREIERWEREKATRDISIKCNEKLDWLACAYITWMVCELVEKCWEVTVIQLCYCLLTIQHISRSCTNYHFHWRSNEANKDCCWVLFGLISIAIEWNWRQTNNNMAYAIVVAPTVKTCSKIQSIKSHWLVGIALGDLVIVWLSCYWYGKLAFAAYSVQEE